MRGRLIPLAFAQVLVYLIGTHYFLRPDRLPQDLLTIPPRSPLLPRKYVVFYNLFIPTKKGRQGINLAKDIVKEQLELVGRTSATSSRVEKHAKIRVFYNSIGTPPNKTWMTEHCRRNNLECIHLNHFSDGNEEVTLQKMHDYCRMLSHRSQRVIYMHSKGSYHNTSANVYWRRHMGKAVTSSECVEPPEASCQVCGLQFYPLWTPFFPGNFFTARCDYVARLLPPKGFATELARVWKNVRKTHKLRLYPAASFTAGAGRQAMEHWIGSHPSLTPCDVATSVSIPDWIRSLHGDEDYFWKLAPRVKIEQGPWFQLKRGALKRLLGNETMRQDEYFLLGGLLEKYKMLYPNSTPPMDSWIWNWFPDGDKWKRHVHGASGS